MEVLIKDNGQSIILWITAVAVFIAMPVVVSYFKKGWGKAIFLFFSLLFLLSVQAIGQQDVWDVPFTESMIAHNRKNMEDNKKATTNQFASQATVNGWHKVTNDFKSLSDNIDKRLTTAGFVLSDGFMMLDIYRQLKEMKGYQHKALALAQKNAWVVPVLLQQEGQVLKQGSNLLQYLSLIAVSYGDINKMKASNRQVIVREVSVQVSLLKGLCYSLYAQMQRLDLATEIRNTKWGGYANKDKEKVKDVINQTKF